MRSQKPPLPAERKAVSDKGPYYAVVRKKVSGVEIKNVIRTESRQACEDTLNKMLLTSREVTGSECSPDSAYYEKIFQHVPTDDSYVLKKTPGGENRVMLIKREKPPASVGWPLSLGGDTFSADGLWERVKKTLASKTE